MKQFIQELAETRRYRATHLMHILREVQARYHYIPEAAIEQIAALLNIPRTQVTGVVEFYSFFHLTPRGQYELLISDSITDHMLGKQDLIGYLSEKLNVAVGEVRQDGRVSLDNTSCTGLCDQGAALQSAFKRGLKETLAELDKSGLRGRGGAGFKTATKWKFCSEERETRRYVVCNADEGEPGTFKDRVLLNAHAHQVFEGMTLCAAIIGAGQGFLYLRGEYLHLYDKLQGVLDERRAAGLLGRDILRQGVSFDIEIRLGAGAYICGEESALIESLEGKMGVPRNRPPYLAVSARHY